MNDTPSILRAMFGDEDSEGALLPRDQQIYRLVEIFKFVRDDGPPDFGVGSFVTQRQGMQVVHYPNPEQPGLVVDIRPLSDVPRIVITDGIGQHGWRPNVTVLVAFSNGQLGSYGVDQRLLERHEVADEVARQYQGLGG